MRIVVAGSRTISKYEVVSEAITRSGFAITTVVSGRCRGPDRFGERWAREHHIKVQPFPADWKRWPRAAGHIRNAEMAKYADGAIIVWDGSSKGTFDMIELCIKQSLIRDFALFVMLESGKVLYSAAA